MAPAQSDAIVGNKVSFPVNLKVCTKSNQFKELVINAFLGQIIEIGELFKTHAAKEATMQICYILSQSRAIPYYVAIMKHVLQKSGYLCFKVPPRLSVRIY